MDDCLAGERVRRQRATAPQCEPRRARRRRTAGSLDRMETPIRLVLADDHALFRQGLKMMLHLETDVEVVGEIGSATELRDMLARTRPGMLLLDLQMERSALADIES